MFGDADRVTAEIIKAASAQATTSTAAWAQELAQQATLSLIQDAASTAAGPAIIARAVSLDLGRLAQLSVSGRPLTPADGAKFVQEGEPIPVRSWNFARGILQPYGLKTITAYTREVAESSNLEGAVKQTLTESFGLGIDAVMLSASPATAAAPAGIFQAAPITATAGGGLNAMLADIKALFTALATNGAGVDVAIVAPPGQVASLKAQVGPKWDYPIFTSTAMAANSVGAVDLTSFVSGFGSEIRFNVSTAGALHMEDTTPGDISGSTPVKAPFQVEMLALRATMTLGWLMRVPGHAQLITGCTW
jgi:hypothetical protein